MVGDRIRDHKILAATGVFAGYTGVMSVLERRTRATGGPGIIAFELAGNRCRAEQIMSRWGPDGQRAARTSMWLDFGYMTTYGVLTGLLVDRARRRWGHPCVLTYAAIVAVAGDAVEGVSLIGVLGGRCVDDNARRARRAALLKFATLAAALGYVVAEAATPAPSG